MEPRVIYKEHPNGKSKEVSLEDLYDKVISESIGYNSGDLEEIRDAAHKQQRITRNLLAVMLKKDLLTADELGDILGVNVVSVQTKED